MADYRLYFMDAQDHIQDAVELDCADDREAVRKSQTLLDGREVELWRRARVVMRFPASNAPRSPMPEAGR
jgi:hypothetical protein